MGLAEFLKPYKLCKSPLMESVRILPEYTVSEWIENIIGILDGILTATRTRNADFAEHYAKSMKRAKSLFTQDMPESLVNKQGMLLQLWSKVWEPDGSDTPAILTAWCVDAFAAGKEETVFIRNLEYFENVLSDWEILPKKTSKGIMANIYDHLPGSPKCTCWCTVYTADPETGPGPKAGHGHAFAALEAPVTAEKQQIISGRVWTESKSVPDGQQGTDYGVSKLVKHPIDDLAGTEAQGSTKADIPVVRPVPAMKEPSHRIFLERL